MPNTFLARINDLGLVHFENALLIITDTGVPIHLSANPRKGFFVYTPFLTTCEIFGTKHQTSSDSYLCHGGRSKRPVNQPWVGETISFCDDSGHITDTTQKIMRIYSQSLRNMIPHFGAYVNMIFQSLSEMKNPFQFYTLNILHEDGDSSYNKFFNSVFDSAVFSRTNGWIIDQGKVLILENFTACALGIDIDQLFQSRLIQENESGEIELSEAFVTLALNEIHNFCPKATHFNADGLLLVN